MSSGWRLGSAFKRCLDANVLLLSFPENNAYSFGRTTIANLKSGSVRLHVPAKPSLAQRLEAGGRFPSKSDGLFFRVQNKSAVAAHFVRLHVPSPDGVQHEETYVQDALQGGRPGRRNTPGAGRRPT